jgi:hypothetical protein
MSVRSGINNPAVVSQIWDFNALSHKTHGSQAGDEAGACLMV